MEAKLQRRVQRYGWDAAAPYYDTAWHRLLKPAHDLLLDLADLRPGMRVLETACGTGLVTFRIADRVAPGGSVLATDIAGDMVAEAENRAAALGLENVKAVRMEAEALTMEDGVYDAALCALGLMYVPDPVKALREMARVTRPGGRVSIVVWGERRNCGWADIFPIIDAQVKSEVCPLFFSLGIPGALDMALDQAGWAQVEVKRIITEMVFPDAATLLHSQIDAGAVALAAKRFTTDARLELETQFLESVSAYRRDDNSYAIPGEFVVSAGIRSP